MPRLIIVSNRVASPNELNNSPAGGLATTLQMALHKRQGIWFGWSGETNTENNAVQSIKKNGVEYTLINLTKTQIDKYYSGFSNQLLWPLCHYRLDLIKYDLSEFNSYIEVNRLFANKLLPLLKEDDIIWVNDYHLILLAGELRQLGCKNHIGFFLHIPFPCLDVFSAAPPYKQLLNGLCRYDLLGFQTTNDKDNFISCITKENLATQIETNKYQMGAHIFKCGVFPATIDSNRFYNLTKAEEKQKKWQHLINQLNDKCLIIGVDRLDYSKGITYRFKAFELLLEQEKRFIERIKFLQITPKSRSSVIDYQNIQQKVAEQTGKINGKFSTINWSPIGYINKNLQQSTLSLLYRQARVALVTPMRDGMNLVAKEYIASQDPDNPGVLILSKFAGAAEQLHNAIIINPYDPQETVDALTKAINMSREERIERWAPMKRYLDENPTEKWYNDFLNCLQQSE